MPLKVVGITFNYIIVENEDAIGLLPSSDFQLKDDQGNYILITQKDSDD